MLLLTQNELGVTIAKIHAEPHILCTELRTKSVRCVTNSRTFWKCTWERRLWLYRKQRAYDGELVDH